MHWLFFVTLLPFASPLDGSGNYYGAEYSGYPNYQERAAMAFTNAVRSDPWNYKFLHAKDYKLSLLGTNILNPSTYPAQPPLYYNYLAGSVARGHSADMSHTGCFQHPSCDGTCIWTRLDAVTNPCPIDDSEGENIAAGNSDPRQTVNQWLCDDNQCTAPSPSTCSCAQQGTACCGDASTTCSCDNDGHRANIMSSHFNITGYGFDDSGCQGYSCNATDCCYIYYWTQDFYSTQTAVCLGPNNMIYSGSHLAAYNTSTLTWFGAQFYDKAGQEPTIAEVNIAGTCTPLTKELGQSAGMGSYSVMLAKGSACRNYYFHFRSAGGVDYYHPEQGVLVTYGEGTCTTAWLNVSLGACPGSSFAPTKPPSPVAPTVSQPPTKASPTTKGSTPTTQTAPTQVCDIDSLATLVCMSCSCVCGGTGVAPTCPNPTCGVQGCSTNVDAFITCANSMNLQGNYPAAVNSLKQCSTLNGGLESAPVSALALVVAGFFGLVA